jgi:hypothetical protein
MAAGLLIKKLFVLSEFPPSLIQDWNGRIPNVRHAKADPGV